MQAEALHPLGLHGGVGVVELRGSEAVLRLLGLADDRVAALEGTGIPAAAEKLGEPSAEGAFKIGEVGYVVKVDDCADGGGAAELLCRRVVRGEHHGFPDIADGLGED